MKKLQSPLVDIEIEVVKQQLANDLPFGPKTSKTMTMGNKINDYMIKMGEDNDQVHLFFTRLLSKGKVKIEFPSCVERLELKGFETPFKESDAACQVDDYIMKRKLQLKTEMDLTDRIVVKPSA